MKKEAEQKLLQEIEDRLFKLIRGDTYFKDDITHRLIEAGDIQQMIANIRNDFPIFHMTIMEKLLNRAIDIYKKRCNLLAKLVRGQSFSIKTYEHTISDYEAQIASHREFRSTMLNAVLDMYFADSPEEENHWRTMLLKLFAQDEVIVAKTVKGYPLTADEIEKVRTLMNLHK